MQTIQKVPSGSISTEATSVKHRKYRVTGILALYGLPRLMTGAILANLVMHAWLKLSNINQLRDDVDHGLRQLMAFIWMERQQQKVRTGYRFIYLLAVPDLHCAGWCADMEPHTNWLYPKKLEILAQTSHQSLLQSIASQF